jgi:hypothetical protein
MCFLPTSPITPLILFCFCGQQISRAPGPEAHAGRISMAVREVRSAPVRL